MSTPSNSNSKTLLTTHEAARRLGLASGTLCNWRVRGVGPKFIRLQGKSARGRGAIRYTDEDLSSFIEEGRGTNSNA